MEVVEVVVAVAVVVLPLLTEPPLAAMEPHRVATERPLAAMAPPRLVAAVVSVAEAVSVAVAVSVAESRQATVPRLVEVEVGDHCPRLMAHLVPAAVDCPPAMVLLLEAVADSQDHLRLTVHLAPVVAVSMEADVDILEAEVVTLTAAAAVEVAIPAVAEATQEAAAVTRTAAVDIPTVAATLEVVEVVTLEVAEVATPEVVVGTLEAEAATLEEAEQAEVATLEVAEAAILEVAEVVKGTLATEVTNINRRVSSPLATTFDLVSSVIEHHRANRSNLNASMSFVPQSKRENVIQRTKIYRSNGTSADSKRNEEKSVVILSGSTSLPKHSE